MIGSARRCPLQRSENNAAERRALTATSVSRVVVHATKTRIERDPLCFRASHPETRTMPHYRALIVALSLASTAALAQTTPAAKPAAPPAMSTPATGDDAQPNRFDEVDTNHDGFISRDEFMAAEKARFAEYDTNHDGKIDPKEIAASPPLMKRNEQIAERMVKQWDQDGDGVVTAAEYQKHAEEGFARQDRDGSGKLTRAAMMGGRGRGGPQKVQVLGGGAAPTKP
jgi:hypothetical protein